MNLVLFFTVTLGVSIVGLVALISVKRFEMATGTVLFGGLRPSLGAFFHRVLLWVERALPSIVAVLFHRLVEYGRWFLHHGIARGLLFLEHSLERVLSLVRYTTHPPLSHREASAFLREVAEHKKKLLRKKAGAEPTV